MATPEEVDFVAHQVTARLLENAADEGHDEALLRACRVWFPDVSQVDDHELKRVARQVRAELLKHRTLILARLDVRTAKGKAKPL